MIACNRPGCGGTLDEAGYCDTCLEQFPPDPTAPAATRRATLPVTPSGPSPAPSAPPFTPASPPLTRPATAHDQPPADAVPETVAGYPAARAWWGLDLVALPALPPVDPADALLADPKVAPSQRFCSACWPPTLVAQSHDGQEALLTGVCYRCRTPFSFVPKLTPGTVVEGRYKISGCIGYGGLGWVYLAEDTHLNDFVALKGRIDAGRGQTAKAAATELEFLTKVAHPNIVRVRDFVSYAADDGAPDKYIVMEYVRGRTVRQVADEDADGMPAEHVLAYCLQLLAALDHLHGRGWLHCDVKPDNVMVEGTTVKLIDLGAGCRVGTVDHGWGTRRYRAPEVSAEAMPTVRSDLFSAGRTLETMFDWTAGGRDASSDPAVESLRNLVRRATAGPAADRFGSAAAMAGQLSGVLRDFVAARTSRPHAAPVSLFGPETGLLDGTLGCVPPLDYWTTEDAFRAATGGLGRPLPDLVPEAGEAARLPPPRPDHPAADLILTLSGMAPEAAIAQMTDAGLDPAEADLLRCRTELSRGSTQAARDHWARARDRFGLRDWRVQWHKALLDLSAGDLRAGASGFGDVHAMLPGEVVPRIGLALCEEILGHDGKAERYYRAAWQSDHSYVSAAFGLARTRMRIGRRTDAVAAVREVPESSRYELAARIAAFRLLTGRSGNPGQPARDQGWPAADQGWPAADQLAEAERLLGRPPLETLPGEDRDRLGAVLLEAKLRHARSAGGNRSPAVESLRSALERCYRALAGYAADRRQHTVLIDLANQVRARTLD